jgi:hypothetical protein
LLFFNISSIQLMTFRSRAHPFCNTLHIEQFKFLNIQTENSNQKWTNKDCCICKQPVHRVLSFLVQPMSNLQ